MKLIHLSDLHIGKKVGAFSMLDDQRVVLDQILEIAQREKPDAVLIAGDVYNKATPSTESVSLFDDFLVKLSKLPGAEVFVLAGNHDSPERIAFANRLIDGAGVHMSSVFGKQSAPVTLNDEFGPVDVYMLPYIKPLNVRHVYPESDVQTYTEAVAYAIDQMHIDTARRNVLLSHQAVTGALRCESELNIGGVDVCDLEPYMPFDYVALGHIHSPQDVRKNHVRYCGTPLKYSFSECGQTKSVTIVEMGEKGEVDVRTEPLEPVHDFVRISGLYDDICKQYVGNPLEDYVEITLKDEYDVPNAFRLLQNYFPRLMVLKYDNARTREKKQTSTVRNVAQRSATEVFASLFEEMQNTQLDAAQIEYLEEVVREVEEDVRCGR